MNSFSAQSIILWKKEYGENDLIIFLLAEGYGRITAIAKNAKKSVKRFGGVLELFTLIDAELKTTRNQAFYILSEVSLESPYERIRTDFLKTAHASYWAEILNGWIEEGHPQDEIFQLFRTSLENLDEDRVPAETLGIIFQIKLLQLSGLSPDFSSCLGCGLEIDRIHDKRLLFDIKDGRTICGSCSSKSHDGKKLRISKGTLNELRWIQKNTCSMAMRLRLNQVSISESRAILERFLPFHMGKDINSLRFLNILRHEI
ncbi:DNA repair protein RecO [Desulforegula conservatrix]|uniref:DNA repair protein RecO n=1 Tax=Desulforegula conservatrix TaxID=153026 RepID=UPI0004223F6C|nr:DNA repair protein RecO [Desulforegula conservatrix]